MYVLYRLYCEREGEGVLLCSLQPSISHSIPNSTTATTTTLHIRVPYLPLSYILHLPLLFPLHFPSPSPLHTQSHLICPDLSDLVPVTAPFRSPLLLIANIKLNLKLNPNPTHRTSKSQSTADRPREEINQIAPLVVADIRLRGAQVTLHTLHTLLRVPPTSKSTTTIPPLLPFLPLLPLTNHPLPTQSFTFIALKLNSESPHPAYLSIPRHAHYAPLPSIPFPAFVVSSLLPLQPLPSPAYPHTKTRS